MRDVKKIERKLCLTNSAAAKICSIANKKGEEKNKIFAAKQMLVYYLGDILVILRKDSYTPDDILLLILKTSMCLNAIRYLFQATLEKDCLNYQTKAGKAHGFNRGMIGRTLELLWEKFQNNSFLYIFMCL